MKSDFVRILSVSALALAAAACSTHPLPQQGVILPAAPPPGEPPGLPGLKTAALEARFGRPDFVRKEGGGQMWRYDAPACKAFFFLYRDEDGQLAVKHVETLPRGIGQIAADATCLGALRARPAVPVS